MKPRALLVCILVVFSSSTVAGATVENFTVELRLDAQDVYVDGQQAQERVYESSEIYSPYIVSGQPAGIVSYGELLELEYLQDSSDVLRITQSSGSVLLPFTAGGHTEVEGEQDSVRDRELLERTDPSFGFEKISEPLVKVAYRFSQEKITGFQGTEIGPTSLAIRNELGNPNATEISIRPVQ